MIYLLYLLSLVQYILEQAKQGRHTNLLAVDYSKAFDKVDQALQLRNCWQCRCDLRYFHGWLTSSHADIRQCMHQGDVTTDWTETTCGLPQGTKLGLVIFAMINDMASSIPGIPLEVRP